MDSQLSMYYLADKKYYNLPTHYIMRTEEYAKKCFNCRLAYDTEALKNNKKEEMLRLFPEYKR